MPPNPLVEVFGYPVGNMLPEAIAHREGRLCPYHNSSGLNCTKNSATDPLGVCTVVDGANFAITCPVRFRQDYVIVSDAAHFFFPAGTRYLALTEVRLNDKYGHSAGNIDITIAALNEDNTVADFGALEVQAVYISGNVSKAFKVYMQNPAQNYAMQWTSKSYPKPDYLSSSRKRLVPQLIYKGGILNSWGKKLAVAVQRPFFEQLPALPQVDPAQSDLAWLVYDMTYDKLNQRYRLAATSTIYTSFKAALAFITTAEPGNMGDFVRSLENRIKTGKIMGAPQPSEFPPSVEPLPEILSDEPPGRRDDGDDIDTNGDN